MKKSKKVFLAIAAIFLVIMVLIGYDISSRTTWPGSKPQLKERLLNNEKELEQDSTNQHIDSTQHQ